AADLTVVELIARFWRHVEAHYRHTDGSPTSEVYNFRAALRPVKELYGHGPARGFGPLALKAVRARMVQAGWTRRTINRAVGRVRAMFKWAASEELVPADVYHALATVAGLQAGRTPAADPEPVGPVDPEHVERTLPHLGRVVAGMVRFQVLT